MSLNELGSDRSICVLDQDHVKIILLGGHQIKKVEQEQLSDKLADKIRKLST